jgi:hypothetical protein
VATTNTRTLLNSYHAVAGIALGHRDDKAKVSFQQVVLGALAVADDPAQIPM